MVAPEPDSPIPPGAPSDRRAPGAPLSALLEDRRLGLTLVSGDPTRRFLDVRWPEREPDRRWLEPGDLRLASAGTPGASFEPLVRAGPAAIVYALTPSERRLPDGLAARARSAGVALVGAPPSTAPERVEAAALRLLAAVPEAAAATHAPQAFLLAALDGVKPERDLLARLHELTGADLVLLNPSGEVVARAGTGTWRPRADAPAGAWTEGRVRLDGREALLYRVNHRGRLRAVLLAFADGRQDPRPLTEFARTLLAMAYERRSAEARAMRAERAGLLALWLAAPTAAGLAPRLAAHGFGPRTPYRVAVGDAGAAATLADAAGEDHFAQRAVPALSDVREGRVVWLFADTGGATSDGSAHTTALLRALAEAGPDGGERGDGRGGGQGGERNDRERGGAPRLGISEVVEGLAAAPEAYRRAATALEQAAPGSIKAYEPDVVAELLSHQPPEQLRALRETVLGGLTAGDPRGKLRATLEAYLLDRHDLTGLAEQLGVHVNTLRYRLKRIEELLGAPLTDPKTLAKLWLATRGSDDRG